MVKSAVWFLTIARGDRRSVSSSPPLVIMLLGSLSASAFVHILDASFRLARVICTQALHSATVSQL